MTERNLALDHATGWRWEQRYAPELNQRVRRELKRTGGSWRVDETYVWVSGGGPTYIERSIPLGPPSTSTCRSNGMPRLPSDSSAGPWRPPIILA